MPAPTQDLHLDFETYCDLDLTKVGVHRYVAHPSFRVLCMAWMFEGRAVRSASIIGPPMELQTALESPDVQAHAFNAAFETAVLARFRIRPGTPLSCTMQRALAYGLPGRLEHAAAALGLKHQKDMAGHRLMLKMSRPLPPKAAPWQPSDYVTLAAYCAKDVEAEAALSAAIPRLLPEEWQLAQLDAAMNCSGELGIDEMRVWHLQAVAEAAGKIDAIRCAALTGGAVTSPGTQTKRLLAWLSAQRLNLPDVARSTIEEYLNNTVWAFQTAIKEVLEIRLRMARASTRKLQRMLDMAEPETGALRGQFQFCGAGRTGRWSGRGVQVQNLPRVAKDFSPDLFTDTAIWSAIRGEADSLDAVAPAPVLDCVSWSLRACLKATDDGKMLWSFDFSQIEARVLAWLAGQHEILAVFASGADVYVWAAAQFGSSDRQLGKVLVLALGFGMGAAKLREQAWKTYKVRMTAGEAERFKDGWRTANYKIVHFWREMDAAAKAAILRRGNVIPAGGSGVAFTSTARTLQMRLPSGRVLYYHKARLDQETGNIVYWGTEAGKPWHEQRTWGGKLAENATQAVARDIMAEAMLRAWQRNSLVPCMSVHDELVYPLLAEGPKSMLRVTTTLADVMLEAPPWAGGLPLDGEHKIMHRYGVAVDI